MILAAPVANTRANSYLLVRRSPVAMGMLVDIDADPIAGFRTGFMAAGTLVAMMGFAAAVLIDPQADLARFRGVGIAAAP